MMSTPGSETAHVETPRKAIAAVRWMAVTLVLAWATPYIFLAAWFAIASLLIGIESLELRRAFVELATLDDASWSTAGAIWTGYSQVFGILVVVWRCLTAQLSRVICRAWVTKLQAMTSKAIDPLKTVVERHPNATGSVFVVVIALGLGVVSFADFFVRTPVQTSHVEVSPSLQPQLPQPGAALHLDGGMIRSGPVTVDQRDQNTFVIVFKDAPK